MFRVGLTGGIASGKSTISQLFSNLGITIIDADVISHQLMQIDQAAYVKTVQHFGKQILHEDRTINRSILRQLIFNQPDQKIWLEKMIHPLIRKKIETAISEDTENSYVLIVVPLLFETGFDKICDHVIAINCPLEVQQKRLIQRDKIDKELALKMINAQLDNKSRLNQADSIIHNQDNKELNDDVTKLHLRLQQLAQQSAHPIDC